MITNISVLGAGIMGSSIARFFAGLGYDVQLYDSNVSILQQVKEAGNRKITVARDLATAVYKADWIIESVSEKLDIKQQLYTGINSITEERPRGGFV